MKPSRIILPLLLSVVVFGFTVTKKKDHWKQLYNGKDLSGWDTYLGPDLDDNGKPLKRAAIGAQQRPAPGIHYYK